MLSAIYHVSTDFLLDISDEENQKFQLEMRQKLIEQNYKYLKINRLDNLK